MQHGSKTCISEVSQYKLILAESLSGPPAILVPQQIVIGKAAEPPLVAEQQHTAPVVLLAADAIPKKVADREKKRSRRLGGSREDSTSRGEAERDRREGRGGRV